MPLQQIVQSLLYFAVLFAGFIHSTPFFIFTVCAKKCMPVLLNKKNSGMCITIHKSTKIQNF